MAGSCALFLREKFGGFLAKSATPQSTRLTYGLFAAAAVAVAILTASSAELLLNGLKPSGPLVDTIFARMGLTASNIIPMSLIVLGLASTAVRERLPGYALAAGEAFTATVTGGYALGIVTAGGTLDTVQLIRLGMIAAASAALWSLLWFAARRRVPGGSLLTAQSLFGLIGVALLAIEPLALVFFTPGVPLHTSYCELGQFGWLLLALAASAAFAQTEPANRGHVLGLTGMVAGALAACAVQPFDEPGRWLSFQALAIAWAIAELGLTVALFRSRLQASGAWLRALSVGLLFLALRYSISRSDHWLAPLALAGDALLLAGVTAMLARKSNETDDAASGRWDSLLQSEAVLAGIAALLAVIAAISGPMVERFAGPLTLILLAMVAALLTAKAPAPSSDRLRFLAMLAAAASIALAGWAWPEPGSPAVWLVRNGWAFVALVIGATACLECVPLLLAGSNWAVVARRVGAWLAAAAVVWLGIVLLQQVPAFDLATRRTALELPEVLAILAGIAALIALALRLALRPSNADPLQFTERGRTGFVYLSEVLLVLFFAHLRLNLPELFLGQAVRYWSFLVMLLAFVGVGFAELFERKGLIVLAIPLRRTGLLLPLIPLLAFWAKPPASLREFADGSAPGMRPLLGYLESLPQHFDSYAGLWFLAGLLYGLIALKRQSFGWALIAALAANAGMWAMLAHADVSAAVHPQVWVIPLSLIVLVSEHINRRELGREASTGLRYIGIGMLYLSSAADMFLAGAGDSLWLAVILAVLCVAGIFAGIMLRVQAFLFLGAGFLLLDIFAMIWHARREPRPDVGLVRLRHRARSSNTCDVRILRKAKERRA